MLAALAREADMAWMMTDSTIIRAYMHAASECKEKGRARPFAWVGPRAVGKSSLRPSALRYLNATVCSK